MADELTEKIIGAAIEVHRILGPGLLESIYDEALCHELHLRGLRAERQVPVDTHYKGIVIKGQILDLLVEGQVGVELKAGSRRPDVAAAHAPSLPPAAGPNDRPWLYFAAQRTRLVV